MSYENKQPPEGINVSAEHPLKDFFAMLTALLLIVVVATLVLSAAAGWLAGFIPFSTEQRLADRWGPRLLDATAEPLSESGQVRQQYVRELAAELAMAMEMPAGMVVTVHYRSADTVNAFATLGGQVLVYEGLVEALSSENALAMVVAHELAHVKLRHPVVAMGRGLTVAIALGSVFGVTDNAAVAQLVQWLGVTSTLSFSRSQELAADAEAAQAVLARYGHLDGAAALFELLDQRSADDGPLRVPEFANTHPDLGDRIARLQQLSAQLDVSGAVTPLPWQPSQRNGG